MKKTLKRKIEPSTPYSKGLDAPKPRVSKLAPSGQAFEKETKKPLTSKGLGLLGLI